MEPTTMSRRRPNLSMTVSAVMVATRFMAPTAMEDRKAVSFWAPAMRKMSGA